MDRRAETPSSPAAPDHPADGPPSGPDGEDTDSPAPGTLRISVPLGRRVVVVSDLLLAADPTPSSRALAAELAATLDQWQGAGTIIVCGNLFARPPGGAPLDAAQGEAVLGAHDQLRDAISEFTARPDCCFVVLPGWRDPEVSADPALRAVLCAVGAAVTTTVDLDLVTAAGERRVLVRPGRPTLGTGGIADAAPAADQPWLAGIDRLENPEATSRFVSSRTLYRRYGRFVWVAPVLTLLVALLIHEPSVYHDFYKIVHRASGPRRILERAYHATWGNRVLFTVGVIVVLEAIVAVLCAIASRRVWKAYGGGALPAPWHARTSRAGESPSSGLLIDGVPALDEARAMVGEGVTGLVTGGSLRAELTHLDPGFFACTGGATELVREHPGHLGLPPVFLHHRQAASIELETGADVHARLLLDDADLPSSTALERLVTGYHVVKGHKPAGDVHPIMVAAWPRGASWPPAPDVAADRVRVRRIRRLAAAAIFVAGFIDVLVAVSRPAAGHLHPIEHYLPIGVVQATGALVALAGIGLMMLARGVLRGQRRAWVVAVAVLAASLALHVVHGTTLGGLFLTLLVLLLLLAERDLFATTADSASLRSAIGTLVAGAAVSVLTASLAIEISGRVRHHPIPPWPTVLGACTERLVGLQWVTLPDEVNRWVAPSMLTIGISLAVITLYLLTRPVVDRQLSGTRQPVDHDHASAAQRAAELRARDIVRRHGVGTLDYFALRDDKQWFFHRDSLVAYAVNSGVCLVSPDPIGPVSERRQVWDAFRRFCDRRGWGIAIMGAGESWLPFYRVSGMRTLYLGDEAVVDIQRFSLQGGKMKGLRQAVSRIARYGYTVRFADPATLTPEEVAPLLELMAKHRRGEVERGFSMMLGRLFDPRDTGLLLTVVSDPAGEPVAMCQFVPSAAIGGFSLDLMRRDPGDHPNGLLDFALCSTIDHLRQQGAKGLSLNFAAMRSTLEGETGDGLTQRMERWALRQLSSKLQIESLWKFNAKYDPEWLPRYGVFDSLEQFGPALISILRSEALNELPVIGRFLTGPPARRGPQAAGSPGWPEAPTTGGTGEDAVGPGAGDRPEEPGPAGDGPAPAGRGSTPTH